MHPFCVKAAGKRRGVKVATHASGGAVASEPATRRHRRFANEEAEEAEEARVAVGQKASSRLDKRARGAIAKQFGGSIGHKLTPSKHKPHVRINITNVNARPRPVPVPVPMGGMGSGMGMGPRMAAPIGFQRGGAVMPGKMGAIGAGAGSGKGRAEMHHALARHRKKQSHDPAPLGSGQIATSYGGHRSRHGRDDE